MLINSSCYVKSLKRGQSLLAFWYADDLHQSGNNRSCGQWSDSEYILKVYMRRLTDGFSFGV